MNKSRLTRRWFGAQCAAFAALAMGAALEAQPMYTQGNRPVMLLANDDGLEPCMPAMIMGDAGGAIMVFPGDSTDLDFVDTLADGDTVWVCEMSDDMAGIVYPDEPRQDCALASPDGADRPYLGPCNWGWVKSEWVSIASP